MKTAAALVFLLLITSCSAKSDFSPSVSSLSGKVMLNGNICSSDAALTPGDRIETSDKSFCEITINSQSIIRIGPNSVFVLQIYVSEVSFELEKGWLSGITRKPFTKLGKYRISTPAITAAVRGTSYCIKAENTQSTYFCVCNGSIEFEENAGIKPETVTSSHHTARRFSIDASRKLVIDSNPGLLYHNDSDIEHLAQAIHEKIDWAKPDKQ